MPFWEALKAIHLPSPDQESVLNLFWAPIGSVNLTGAPAMSGSTFPGIGTTQILPSDAKASLFPSGESTPFPGFAGIWIFLNLGFPGAFAEALANWEILSFAAFTSSCC